MRNAIFIIVLLVFVSCEDPFVGYRDYTVLEEVLYDVGEEENNSEEDVTEDDDVEEVVFECNQSVILKSQAEVDAFGQLNCSEVGDIWIEEIDGTITNLKSLKRLMEI